MVEELPPLVFRPLIKAAPWGGRQLERVFSKVLPEGVPCGESWEVVDLPSDQSVVAEGRFAAHSLESLIRAHPEALLGEVPLLQGRFPLLYKFIDARQNLSVQVHPDAAACARLGAGARPKAEAWYVVAAEEGARLYIGLRPGAGLADLERALATGGVEDLLLPVAARAGEFYYLPAGTLHAIGAGIVLAEIQQASDTTFRVYDWNRPGLDGRPRTLHKAEALLSIDENRRGQIPAAPPSSGRPGVRCEHFSFERARIGEGDRVPLPAGRPRLVSCLEGAGRLGDCGPEAPALAVGRTVLLPAGRAAELTGEPAGSFLLVHM